VLKTLSGDCYSYVGNYVGYVAPSGYVVANVNEFTATTATTYTDCVDCLTVTAATTTYNTWRGSFGFALNCPVCQITDFGKKNTFYTSNLISEIATDVYVFSDSSLTKPITEDYLQYGNFIYKVDVSGKLTQFCTVNGNCK
jgi:hypothetical protein